MNPADPIYPTPKMLAGFVAAGRDAQTAVDELTEGGPSAELAALYVARDALANALEWVKAMHPTKSRLERITMYGQAHAAVAYVIAGKRHRP
jgi:hypothetical protein